MTPSTAAPAGKRPAPWLAAAFGGGGPFGISYAVGVVDALRGAGVPVDGMPMLGTSAGSWVASCLATGRGIDDLAALRPIRVPNPTAGLLRAVAFELLGEATSPRVRASAVVLPTGRRVILDGAQLPLADLVAASSSVPALFRPARIGRRLYVDGGVRSLVSADHAADAAHLLVVAPIAGPMFGPAGRTMELMLRRELGRWERRCGGTAHLIRPGRSVAALARHPLDLFDYDRAAEAYVRGHEQAVRLLDSRPELAALAVDTRRVS